MSVSYDPAKRAETLRTRGLDFGDAELVFAGLTYDALDTRANYGEARIQTVGYLNGRMMMVVWPPRGIDRHVISMGKCNDREQHRYSPRL